MADTLHAASGTSGCFAAVRRLKESVEKDNAVNESGCYSSKITRVKGSIVKDNVVIRV